MTSSPSKRREHIHRRLMRPTSGTRMILCSKPLIHTVLVKIMSTAQLAHSHQVQSLVTYDTGSLRDDRDGGVGRSGGVVRLDQLRDSLESDCGGDFDTLGVRVFFYSL